jgi:hypothetical protein
MALHLRDDRLYEDLNSFNWASANQDAMSQRALSQFNHPVLAVQCCNSQILAQPPFN